MNKIIQAARLAEECHRGQVRKWTLTPYIYHPMRVAGRVMLLPGATEDMVCAGLLHDVIEDCTLTVEQWRRWPLGGSYNLVVQLTNEFTAEKYPKFNRQKRKELEFERISKISYEAKLIKACDRIENLNEMAGAEGGFKVKYAQESLLLGEALLTGYEHDTLLKALVNELKLFAFTYKAAA